MNCARCDHPESRHCKGGVKHVSQYKGASVNEVIRTCVSRHCLNPLCSCVDFVEPKYEASTGRDAVTEEMLWGE